MSKTAWHCRKKQTIMVCGIAKCCSDCYCRQDENKIKLKC